MDYIMNKEALREQIRDDIEQFFKDGGEITYIPPVYKPWKKQRYRKSHDWQPEFVYFEEIKDLPNEARLDFVKGV